MKVLYVTQVLKQDISFKTMCPHCILEFRNKKSYFIASLSRWVGQDRICHQKSCLLNCWSLLL